MKLKIFNLFFTIIILIVLSYIFYLDFNHYTFINKEIFLFDDYYNNMDKITNNQKIIESYLNKISKKCPIYDNINRCNTYLNDVLNYKIDNKTDYKSIINFYSSFSYAGCYFNNINNTYSTLSIVDYSNMNYRISGNDIINSKAKQIVNESEYFINNLDNQIELECNNE